MATVQNYQCPACGGPLAFDAASGKLTCSYCDGSFLPEEIAAQHGAPVQEEAGAGSADEGTFDGQGSSWNTDALNGDWGQDAAAMREYNCPSCGATLICEQTTAATSCPYCDNPTVVETQFAGTLRPDYIIPFKLRKEQAVEALSGFYKGKPLLPKAFAAKNHLEEVKGVYVPFWFFDGTAAGSATFRTTTSLTQVRGQDTVCVTRSYQCLRAGEVDFSLVPVDASRKMDDDLMDSIEPYDYSELKPFSTGFLPGYLANIHDVSAEDCFARANARCATTCVRALQGTVTGYETCRLEAKHITLRQGTVHYGLLPVYLLNTRFEEKNYTFAVNGQSGKVVGDLPESGGRAAGAFLKRFLATLVFGGLVGAGLLSFLEAPLEEAALPLGCILLFMGFVIAGAMLASDRARMRTVAAATTAGRYAAGTVRLSGKSDTFINESARVISTTRPVQPGGTGGYSGGGYSGGMGGGFPGGSFGARPGGYPGGGGGFSGGGGGGSFPGRPQGHGRPGGR